MKNNIQILLNRRNEIRNQINKLESEYQAIGEVIQELLEYKQNEKDKEDERNERNERM